jgi:hypothetical protein
MHWHLSGVIMLPHLLRVHSKSPRGQGQEILVFNDDNICKTAFMCFSSICCLRMQQWSSRRADFLYSIESQCSRLIGTTWPSQTELVSMSNACLVLRTYETPVIKSKKFPKAEQAWSLFSIKSPSVCFTLSPAFWLRTKILQSSA